MSKIKKISIISGCSSLFLVAAILLTTLLFIPNGRQNKIQKLIDSGDYDGASSLIEKNGDYGKTEQLLAMCNAGKAFKDGDFESGIDFIYNIGGTVNVNYDADGGTLEKKTEVIKKSKYIDNNPYKTGYTFYGWDQTNYSINSKLFLCDLDLLASYTPDSYTITYDLDGGTNSESNPTIYNIESDTIHLEPASRVGYTFIGWESNGTIISEIAKGSYGDKHLIAKWNINKYKVIVTSEDNSKGTVTGDGYYDYNSKVTIKANPNNGYSFRGWYQNGTNISSSDVYSFTLDANDISFEAKWKIITYSIYYELDGGTNDFYNPTSYTVEDSKALYNPSKVGYTFAGWYIGDTKYENIPEGTYGNLRLTAHWLINSYNVTVTSENTSKGTVSGGGSYQYNSKVTITATPNNGYSFDGWYQSGSKVSSSASYSFTLGASNVSFEAKWKIITYSISYELNGGTNNTSNPTTYTVEDSKTLYYPSKTGYTFDGWYINTTKYSTIPEGTYGNLTLTAHWLINSYNVAVTSENTSKGTVSGGGSYQYNSKVTITATPNNGYSFDGWYQSGSKVSSSASYSFTLGASNVSFEAKWKIITYSISYELNGGTNNTSNPTTYNVEDSKTLYNPSKTGYTFAGWYSGGTKYYNIPSGTYGNLTFVANWSINSYNVTVLSTDTSKGTVSGSGPYQYNSNVTITATPTTNYAFYGWYSDSGLTNLVSRNATYSFTMGSKDMSFYAKFWTKAEEEKEIEEYNIAHGIIPSLSSDGKYITYGMYPQTNVNDSSLISTLDTLSNPNEYGYYIYNNEYYYKYSATLYTSGYKFDNGSTITSGTNYWFKVEPIKWKILDNEDGIYFLTTESLLTNHMYNSYYSGTQSKTDYQGNTATVYANNYKYSDIRSWLNTDFYNQAFFLDNDNIKVSEVDNSVSSTGYSSNSYACENTNDKLFLLSNKELTNTNYGFNSGSSNYDTERRCKTTDFARAHGTHMNTSTDYYQNGWYYTRSPHYSDSNGVRFVGHGDYIYDNYGVGYAYYGVRPALRLSL